MVDAAEALQQGAQTGMSVSLSCVDGRMVNAVVIDGQSHWPTEGAKISNQLKDRFHLIYDEPPYKVYFAREDAPSMECGTALRKTP